MAADLEKGKGQEASSYDTGDLPTLEQVLHRKTLPPVCLFNFYIVLRDRLHAEEYLDFYLDVSSHENLWKLYLKDLKRTGVITEQELLDAGADSVAGRAMLNRVSYNSISKGSMRSYRPITPDDDTRGLVLAAGPAGGQYPPSTDPSTNLGPEAPIPYDLKNVNRNSVMSAHVEGRAVTRQDVSASAERIYHHYIMPSATKELHDVPKPFLDRVTNMLENDGRIDPGVFAETKNAVFSIMETEHFPKFLRYKVWSNTTWTQSLFRLVTGLVCLFIGFTVELSIIFLAWTWGSHYTRIWGLLPLIFGIFNIFVGLTQLDPLWVLIFGVSETTTFRFNKIRQPIVRQILYPRAVWLLLVTVVITVIVTVVFCVVPSGVLYAP